MTTPPTKLEREARLARYRNLAREFPKGSMAEMLRDMLDELRQQVPRTGQVNLAEHIAGDTQQ